MIEMLEVKTPMVTALVDPPKDAYTAEYTKHFVCFIDLLGVRASVNSDTNRNKIFTALNIYKKIRDTYAKEKNITLRLVDEHNRILSEDILNMPYQSSFFSDSLIISYGHSNPRSDLMDLYCVILDMNILAYTFLSRGIFIRGGLSYGDLYHEGDICFGSALVEAVNLESKIAIHPRIAIAPHILDPTSTMFPFSVEDFQKRKHTWRTIIHRTGLDQSIKPHVFFCDYLAQCLPNDRRLALQIKAYIVHELNTPHPDTVMAKYEWMKRYFNGQLSTTKNPPAWFEDIKISE